MNYIVVRLEKVFVSDDMDMDFGDKGPEGEIQYMATVATGNQGKQPIVVQNTGFPVENWYEAEGGGVNANFLNGQERALPLFCYPESQMGDNLLITFAVVDDDVTSDAAIMAHQVAAKVGTAVATIMAGPTVGGLVAGAADAMQKAIVKAGQKDIVGIHTNVLSKAENFGLPKDEHFKTINSTDGKMSIQYSIMRVSVLDPQKNWCVGVTLDQVKIVYDADGDELFVKDAGDIYIRTRVADGYVGQIFSQTLKRFPTSGGTRDVYSGHNFPLPEAAQDRSLYFNNCKGLPPFLYIEVGVFDSDTGLFVTGRTGDDALGVLPLMFTNRWMREHKGQHTFEYPVTGNDTNSEKAIIRLTVSIWDPKDGPDSGL